MDTSWHTTSSRSSTLQFRHPTSHVQSCNFHFCYYYFFKYFLKKAGQQRHLGNSLDCLISIWSVNAYWRGGY